MPRIASKITPHLWFAKDAEEAAKLYVSLLPDSRIDAVTALPADTPSGPAGSVRVIELTLSGQSFLMLEAGPLDPFNRAISFLVHCEDQAEIDRLWEGFVRGGGAHDRCGWLKDRFGVYWQIVPRVFSEMMRDPDRARAKRVTTAMLKMEKLDIAALKRAFEG